MRAFFLGCFALLGVAAAAALAAAMAVLTCWFQKLTTLAMGSPALTPKSSSNESIVNPPTRSKDKTAVASDTVTAPGIEQRQACASGPLGHVPDRVTDGRKKTTYAVPTTVADLSTPKSRAMSRIAEVQRKCRDEAELDTKGSFRSRVRDALHRTRDIDTSPLDAVEEPGEILKCAAYVLHGPDLKEEHLKALWTDLEKNMCKSGDSPYKQVEFHDDAVWRLLGNYGSTQFLCKCADAMEKAAEAGKGRDKVKKKLLQVIEQELKSITSSLSGQALRLEDMPVLQRLKSDEERREFLAHLLGLNKSPTLGPMFDECKRRCMESGHAAKDFDRFVIDRVLNGYGYEPFVVQFRQACEDFDGEFPMLRRSIALELERAKDPWS